MIIIRSDAFIIPNAEGSFDEALEEAASEERVTLLEFSLEPLARRSRNGPEADAEEEEEAEALRGTPASVAPLELLAGISEVRNEVGRWAAPGRGEAVAESAPATRPPARTLLALDEQLHVYQVRKKSVKQMTNAFKTRVKGNS